jgi:hypothetical protein
MKITAPHPTQVRLRMRPLALAACLVSGQAMAFQLDTGESDIKVRWDC